MNKNKLNNTCSSLMGAKTSSLCLSDNVRLDYIDAVAGLMILRMIFGHCRLAAGMNDFFWVISWFSFFMPWFYYKSGMFFTPRPIRGLLKRDLKKFIFPFFAWGFVGVMVWMAIGFMSGEIKTVKLACFKVIDHFLLKGGVKGNNPLWFLISLFLVRIVFSFFLKWLNPLIIGISGFLFAFLLYSLKWYEHSFWFGNVFSGLFFFSCGYYLNRVKKNENKSLMIIIAAVVYLGCVLWVVLGKIELPFLYFWKNNMVKGNYLLFYPVTLAAIILINNFFRWVSPVLKFPILRYIGRNSMNFYVTHMILLVIISFIIKHLFNIRNTMVVFGLLMLSCAVFLPFISLIIDNLKSKINFKKTNHDKFREIQ